MERNRILLGDNLDLMAGLAAGSFQMVYADPPFNTGKQQSRQALRTVADTDGDRTGFGGRRYRTERRGASYSDAFDDFTALPGAAAEADHRLLNETGMLYLHIDYREAHYVKVMLDGIFGRESFLNEIIWAYDYGGKSKRRWPAKHDTILVYVKDPDRYYFDSGEVDREPYMAPGLVTPRRWPRANCRPTSGGFDRADQRGRRPATRPRNRKGSYAGMVLASTRPGTFARPLLRFGNARRGLPETGPGPPADRREPGSGRDRGKADQAGLKRRPGPGLRIGRPGGPRAPREPRATRHRSRCSRRNLAGQP